MSLLSESVEAEKELLGVLVGASKQITRLPTLRRDAIQFRYEGVSDKYNMENIGRLMSLRPDGEVDRSSSSCGPLYRERSDSWEIELCVGMAVMMIIYPRWEAIKQLGRSLLVLKVHKYPKICELFFMKYAEVVATYKDRMPQTVKYASMYNLDGEVALWAELYTPRGLTNAGRRSNSFLTDEFCGAFGTRFVIPEKFQNDGTLKDTLCQLSKPVEEVAELAKKAQAQIEKKQKKRARQKQKKIDAREKAAKEADEEIDEKEACIICYEGRSSYIFEECRHLCVCKRCAMNILDETAQPTSKKSMKVCPLCRQLSRLVHIYNYRGNGDDVFAEDAFDA